MRNFFYASVHGIKTDIKDIFEIEKGMYLTEDPNIKSQIIDIEKTRSIIGLIETTSIQNTSVFSFAVSTDLITPNSEKKRLHEFIMLNHFFCLALWLQKDNSAYLQLGFLNYGNNRDRYHSNYIAMINSHSDASRHEQFFNESELSKVRIFYEKIKTILLNDNTNGYTQLSEESTRIMRALYYIQASRMYEDLAIKITFFYVSLEALFLDNSKSPSKQLADNASSFIEPNDAEKRNRIRSMLIRNYDLRSSTIHGYRVPNHVMKEQNRKLISAALELDNFVRSILTKVLLDEKILQNFKS